MNLKRLLSTKDNYDFYAITQKMILLIVIKIADCHSYMQSLYQKMQNG